MTNSTNGMTSFTPYSSKDSVIIANGIGLPISHLGQSSFSHDGHSFQLNNVLCVSSIHKSLLSIRRFSLDNNCFFELDGFSFRAKDNNTK